MRRYSPRYTHMVLGIIMFVVLAPLVIAWEYSVWQECSKDHPWWYCLRIMSN